MTEEGRNRSRRERLGEIVLALSVALMLGSVTALLIVSVKFMGDLPLEGMYRNAYDWIVVWNLGSFGAYLAVVGAALLLPRARAEGRRRFPEGLTLAGASFSLIGQLLDITLGNPLLAGPVGANDDFFSAVGQAISLMGLVIFIAGAVLLWRSGVRSLNQGNGQ